MFVMIASAGAGFTVGVLFTALIASWIIGLIHAEAAKMVDSYGGVRLFERDGGGASVRGRLP